MALMEAVDPDVPPEPFMPDRTSSTSPAAVALGTPVAPEGPGPKSPKVGEKPVL